MNKPWNRGDRDTANRARYHVVRSASLIRGAFLLKGFLLVFLVFPAFFSTEIPAAAEDNTLKIAMKTRIDTLAPSRSTTRETFIMCHHWADTLVYRDPKLGNLMPCLAESYRLLGKEGIEFK